MRISAHHLPRNCAITLLAPLAGVTLHNQILALDIAEPAQLFKKSEVAGFSIASAISWAEPDGRTMAMR